MTPQAYDGPATFHVDGDAHEVARLRVELQPSSSVSGTSLTPPRVVVIVLEPGSLPRDRTKVGDLRLPDRQELTARWTGFRFEL